MRALVVVLVAGLTLGMSACGDDDSSDDTTADDTTTESVAPGEFPDVVGETVDEATATLEDAGFTLRVIQRDGEDLAATADFVDNRVNVAVETQDDGSEVVTAIVSTG